MTWQSYAADTPRFVLPSGWLLIEGQRTNSIRNPRGEGLGSGSAASGAGAPTGATYWNHVNRTSGLAAEWQPISALGMQGIRIRYHGTTGSGGGIAETLEFENRSSAAVTPGLPVTGSFFYRVVAGVFPAGGTIAARVLTLTSGASVVDNSAPVMPTPDATLRRAINTVTPSATAAYGTVGAHFLPPPTASVDVTLEYFWPQFEQGAFASTPILPPIGTPAASTRGADLVSATLSSLGIGGDGACTILGTFNIPQSAPSGVNQVLLHIDDGTSNNAFLARNTAGGDTITIHRTFGGVGAGAITAGTMTPGTAFKFGLTISAGRLAASMNGGAVVAHTGGPTSGLTTLRVGNSPNLEALFGTVGTVIARPRAVSDSELQSLVNALSI